MKPVLNVDYVIVLNTVTPQRYLYILQRSDEDIYTPYFFSVSSEEASNLVEWLNVGGSGHITLETETHLLSFTNSVLHPMRHTFTEFQSMRLERRLSPGLSNYSPGNSSYSP